jgi:hypothetical protein
MTDDYEQTPWERAGVARDDWFRVFTRVRSVYFAAEDEFLTFIRDAGPRRDRAWLDRRAILRRKMEALSIMKDAVREGDPIAVRKSLDDEEDGK